MPGISKWLPETETLDEAEPGKYECDRIELPVACKRPEQEASQAEARPLLTL
jgi:hypothetical protein